MIQFKIQTHISGIIYDSLKSFVEIICPKCSTLNYIFKTDSPKRCYFCSIELIIPYNTIMGEIEGRNKYHLEGWKQNDRVMLDRYNKIALKKLKNNK